MAGQAHSSENESVDHGLSEELSECPCETLDKARRGDRLIVVDVGDERARVHAIRFGMCEGACVSCVTRIPAGPIVLRSGRQEIAVGRELAKKIRVRKQGRVN